MANRTPKKKLDQIADLIVEKRGNVSAIARTLKVTRTTLYNQIQADETLKLALSDAREEMLDTAEDQLGQAVSSGEAWAVCFTLKTQGQERGYIEKQKHELTGKDGKDLLPQKFVVEIVGK